MRLWTVFTLFLLFSFAPLTLQFNYNDTQLEDKESWRIGASDKIVERKDEEANEEYEATKRTPLRGGSKRRRRLRKRPRTTEAPTEQVKEVLNSEYEQGEPYGLNVWKLSEEEITFPPEELPKRKIPKRRRMPHRRYPDPERTYEREQEEVTVIKPVRRRRKGGRKRVKPITDCEECLETTTTPKISPSESESKLLLHRDKMKDVSIMPTITTSTEAMTSTTNNTSSINTSVSAAPKSNEDVNENRVQNQHNIEEKDKDEQVTNRFSAHQFSEQYSAKKTKLLEQMDDKGFGNKIFDRRTLFSKSRQLPETSAILRKRLLLPKSQEALNVHIFNPLENLGSNFYNKDASRNEISLKVKPPIGTSMLPESISSKALIDKMKYQIITSHAEEPTNLKMELERSNQQENIYSMKSYHDITEPSVEKQDVIMILQNQETTTVMETTINEDYFEEKALPTTHPNVNASLFDLSEKIHNKLSASNLKDSLLDLLKTEGTHISKILELRNMTIEQLLEHRERGSRKFVLPDMFEAIKNKHEKNEEELPTTTERDNTVEQIQFPEEEILGLFPKFISDQIHKHTQKKEHRQDNETKYSEPRESRSYEKVSVLTTETVYPIWRIIPNPRLQPVSTNGNFKEIKITDIIPENSKDKFLVEESNNAWRNKISDSYKTETVKTNNSIYTFKQIPFSVKSAIIISGAILALAIFGFMSVLISCRVQQKKNRIRAKQDVMCEHLKNEDFMTSQQSLSPVLSKHQRGPVFSHEMPSNSNRHYYLWRTLRKTFQYD